MWRCRSLSCSSPFEVRCYCIWKRVALASICNLYIAIVNYASDMRTLINGGPPITTTTTTYTYTKANHCLWSFAAFALLLVCTSCLTKNRASVFQTPWRSYDVTVIVLHIIIVIDSDVWSSDFCFHMETTLPILCLHQCYSDKCFNKFCVYLVL